MPFLGALPSASNVRKGRIAPGGAPGALMVALGWSSVTWKAAVRTQPSAPSRPRHPRAHNYAMITAVIPPGEEVVAQRGGAGVLVFVLVVDYEDVGDFSALVVRAAAQEPLSPNAVGIVMTRPPQVAFAA